MPRARGCWTNANDITVLCITLGKFLFVQISFTYHMKHLITVV